MPVLRYFVRFFSNGFRVPSLTLRSLTHFAEAGAHGQSEKEGSNFVLCQHREFNMLSFFLICAPNTFVRVRWLWLCGFISGPSLPSRSCSVLVPSWSCYKGFAVHLRSGTAAPPAFLSLHRVAFAIPGLLCSLRNF